MKTPTKASLTLEFTAIDLNKHPEDCPHCDGEFDPDKHEGMKIDIKVHSDTGLDLDDISPDDPEQFMEQGMLMAVIEALVRGLQAPRGTSFEYATDDALEKMQAARNMLRDKNLVDRVLLGLADPEGEC